MKRIYLVAGLLLLSLTILVTGCQKKAPEAEAAVPAVTAEPRTLVFGGGPAGGTFQVVANSIQTYDPLKSVSEFVVKASHQQALSRISEKRILERMISLSCIQAMSILVSMVK